MKTLLDECIEALGKPERLGDKESQVIVDDFLNAFPITPYGRIDWIAVTRRSEKTTLEHLDIPGNEEVFIIWDLMDLPVLRCTFENALMHIDDVTAVSFDTWLFGTSRDWVLEFYHEGELTLGYRNDPA